MIEPICWIRQDGVISFHKQKEIDSQYFKWHPLYLHPMRELTDEEIIDAMFLNDTDLMGLLEMMPSVKEKMIQRGRALLKKAGEE